MTTASPIEAMRAALGPIVAKLGFAEWATPEHAEQILQDLIKTHWEPARSALEAATLSQPAVVDGWKDDVNKAITDAETSLTARCTMAWNGKGHLGEARDVARSVWGTFSRLREDLKLPPFQRPPFAEEEEIPPSTDEFVRGLEAAAKFVENMDPNTYAFRTYGTAYPKLKVMAAAIRAISPATASKGPTEADYDGPEPDPADEYASRLDFGSGKART